MQRSVKARNNMHETLAIMTCFSAARKTPEEPSDSAEAPHTRPHATRRSGLQTAYKQPADSLQTPCDPWKHPEIS